MESTYDNSDRIQLHSTQTQRNMNPTQRSRVLKKFYVCGRVHTTIIQSAEGENLVHKMYLIIAEKS